MCCVVILSLVCGSKVVNPMPFFDQVLGLTISLSRIGLIQRVYQLRKLGWRVISPLNSCVSSKAANDVVNTASDHHSCEA